MADTSEAAQPEPVHVLLVDSNAPWVRALFEAMPPHVTVSAFRTCGPIDVVRHPWRHFRGRRWRAIGERWFEQKVVVPSWSRLPRLTTATWARHINQRISTLSGDVVIVYTLPYYSDLPPKWMRAPQVYFAYDPYACYAGWDPAVVESGERGLSGQCDAAFAISSALADDFRKLSSRPVFVQPNGISQEFLRAFDKPHAAPNDLPLGGPPVVGCVGQIGRAYDWDLLDAIVSRCTEFRFVFVGPIVEEGLELRKRMDRLCTMPNVSYLGPKPHDEIPRYIQRFDVCLIPLRCEPCNRSKGATI